MGGVSGAAWLAQLMGVSGLGLLLTMLTHPRGYQELRLQWQTHTCSGTARDSPGSHGSLP